MVPHARSVRRANRSDSLSWGLGRDMKERIIIVRILTDNRRSTTMTTPRNDPRTILYQSFHSGPTSSVTTLIDRSQCELVCPGESNIGGKLLNKK